MTSTPSTQRAEEERARSVRVTSADGPAPLVSVRYFHAGPVGIAAVLPPNLTGAVSTGDYGACRVCRRDRVYVTTDFLMAVGFASLVPPDGRGAVYEVAPLNPVPDPDCSLPGLSYEAERAAIIRRMPIPGKLLKKARKAMWS